METYSMTIYPPKPMKEKSIKKLKIQYSDLVLFYKSSNMPAYNNTLERMILKRIDNLEYKIVNYYK